MQLHLCRERPQQAVGNSGSLQCQGAELGGLQTDIGNEGCGSPKHIKTGFSGISSAGGCRIAGSGIYFRTLGFYGLCRGFHRVRRTVRDSCFVSPRNCKLPASLVKSLCPPYLGATCM